MPRSRIRSRGLHTGWPLIVTAVARACPHGPGPRHPSTETRHGSDHAWRHPRHRCASPRRRQPDRGDARYEAQQRECHTGRRRQPGVPDRTNTADTRPHRPAWTRHANPDRRRAYRLGVKRAPQDSIALLAPDGSRSPRRARGRLLGAEAEAAAEWRETASLREGRHERQGAGPEPQDVRRWN